MKYHKKELTFKRYVFNPAGLILKTKNKFNFQQYKVFRSEYIQ